MSSATLRFLKIVLGSVLLACLLGIQLDLVTANVAVEYFSVHHPRIVASENPFVLAVVWGIAASWWFGAIAGAILATVNHLRPHPLSAAKILKWSAIACFILWVLMIAILVIVMAIAGTIPETDRRPTFEQDRRLVAVAMAHQYEYLFGAIALLVISLLTWRSPPRQNPTSSATDPPEQVSESGT